MKLSISKYFTQNANILDYTKILTQPKCSLEVISLSDLGHSFSAKGYTKTIENTLVQIVQEETVQCKVICAVSLL